MLFRSRERRPVSAPQHRHGEQALLASRPDLATIAQWVAPGARVLDLGCGDGALLRHLADARSARGYGVEISHQNIVACVRNGINVIQGDLESGLAGFESGSFDVVILSLTLQAMRHTEAIIDEMLRVGREGIVTFPNFGHWRNRLAVLQGGMPVSKNLPYQWFDTPNVHLCTIADFEAYCRSHGIAILDRAALSDGAPVGMLPNLMGEIAVFRFRRG